jgi:hypothetical protein
VVALLFSPEGIIQEESARLVARSSMELYKSATRRVPLSTKTRLDKIVDTESDSMELLFEKVKFLSANFAGIPEEDLLSLAADMKYVNTRNSEFRSLPDRSIIWSLSGEASAADVMIHFADQLNGTSEKIQISEGASYYFLSLGSVEEFHYQHPDKSFEILKYIDNNEE